MLFDGLGKEDWSSTYFADDLYTKVLKEALTTYIPDGLKITVSNMPKTTKTSDSDFESTAPASPISEARDILLLPHMLQIKNVTPPDFDNLTIIIAKALVNKLGPLFEHPLEIIDISKENHLVVCTNQAVDCRCGETGGAVYEKLKEELERKGLSEKWKVWKSTHVGGHQYAANVL
jgi:hypothetical protein